MFWNPGVMRNILLWVLGNLDADKNLFSVKIKSSDKKKVIFSQKSFSQNKVIFRQEKGFPHEENTKKFDNFLNKKFTKVREVVGSQSVR